MSEYLKDLCVSLYAEQETNFYLFVHIISNPDYHVSNITINTSVSSVTVFEVLTYVIFKNLSPNARLRVSCQLKV